jgi:hypothetical protein
MNAAPARSVQGHILLVQEERFRLLADSGRSYLFTLAHGASLDSEALHRFHQQHTHVTVEYEGEPDLASCVARCVRESGPGR